MKNHKRLLVFLWKYTKTPMSKFECFGHAVKGQSYHVPNRVTILFKPSITLWPYYYMRLHLLVTN